MPRKHGDGNLTMREIGRKGGQTTKARHGLEHYQALGRKGGDAVKRLIALGRERESQERKGGGR